MRPKYRVSINDSACYETVLLIIQYYELNIAISYTIGKTTYELYFTHLKIFNELTIDYKTGWCLSDGSAHQPILLPA